MRDLGITFAGGGNRSFYQQGLFEVWGERLFARTAAASGCSAGAAILVLLLSGRTHEARSHWDERRRGLRKNIDLTRALRGERIAPHGAIYRATVLHALADGGLERIRALPFPLYVLCARPPRGLSIGVSTWLGFGGYALEKRLKPQMLHPSAGERLGFRPVHMDARSCQSPEELADLVLASSATPPFTPVGNFRGQPLLDGGLVDNAPADIVERHPEVCQNLVLLTRPYPQGVTGRKGSRLYLAPTEPVPVERWDYTEDAPVDETLALGRRDAERHRAELEMLLGERAEDARRPRGEIDAYSAEALPSA
jgi:predicted acylesterase/phospholipase RssA